MSIEGQMFIKESEMFLSLCVQRGGIPSEEMTLQDW